MKKSNLFMVLTLGTLLSLVLVGCINVVIPGKKGDDKQSEETGNGDKQNFIKINTEKK